MEVRSPVRSADDEMKSCVVEDCDELTLASCQSLVMQNDVGWNGIVVSAGKVVEEEEIGGDGGTEIDGGEGCGVW